MSRRFLTLTLLTLALLRAGSGVSAWTEPAIAPILMTSPLAPPPVTGATYYVDKNSLGGTCNNANPGTQTQPWCTLSKGMQTALAGDQVTVRTATYAEGDLRPTHSGTAGNYITFRAFPGDSPVINCAGATWCIDGFSASSPAYVVFDGFEMRNPNQQYLVCQESSGCHHIWFINGKYHDNGATNSGFILSFGHVLSNNEIYNTGVMVAYTPSGHENIFEFNRLHDNGRNGDDDGVIKCGTGAWNCILRYNTVSNNWRDPASTNPCFTPGQCQGMTGLYIDQGRDGSHAGAMSYVYNNIVHDNDIGIQVWDTQGARVFNNLVYHNGFTAGFGTFVPHFGMGITVDFSGVANVQVLSNTTYGNRTVGLDFGSSPASAIISRNNLVMNNGVEVSANSGGANSDLDYDLIADTGGGTLISWNGTTYASLGSFLARGGNTTWLHAVSGAALFVNAPANNFRQQAGSPARNSGATVALFTYDLDNATRPIGPAWDIGAYEWQSTTHSHKVVQ
jgi:Right handed beta helix region